MRNFLDDSIAEHRSYPPLRWIANWAGNRASSAMLKAIYIEEDVMEEKAEFGFRYSLNLYIYNLLWPLYYKYGTTYRLRMDLSGPAWDDYDADGIPYWEKTGTVDPEYSDPNYYGWNYDPVTGDSWRIKK